MCIQLFGFVIECEKADISRRESPVSQSENANPLIHEDQASTIDAICNHLEWMVIQKGQDAEAHPGEVYQLRMVLSAAHAIRCVDLHK